MRFALRLLRIPMPFNGLMGLCVMIIVMLGFVPTQLMAEPSAFIEIGKTTKEQVDAALPILTVFADEGEEEEALKRWKLMGGDWWLYDRLAESLMLEPDCGTQARSGRNLLLIKFDANEVVSECDVFASSKSEGCAKGPICWRGKNFMLFDLEEADNLAKTFQRPPDKCAIYLYAKGPNYYWAFPIRVKFNNEWEQQVLIKYSGFLYWEANYGQHQITVTSRTSGSPKRYPVTFDVDCEKPDVLFIEYQKTMAIRQARRQILSLVEESKGHREINKRRLIAMD